MRAPDNVTATIFPFGGQITDGFAVSFPPGAFRSIVMSKVVTAPAPIWTLHWDEKAAWPTGVTVTVKTPGARSMAP